MAKKKPRSVIGLIGEAMRDVVDAASVAATGSQLGVLELAAEEEMHPTTAKRKRKAKTARKKTKVVKKAKKKATTTKKTKKTKKAKKKRGAKRTRR
jgi:hypothetical protein